MLTFDKLTPEQQDKAKAKAVDNLLRAICEGAVRFNDALNGDDLQARIDAAGDRANAMQTPWFWASYIMDTCREDLESMAQCDAEDALYPEPGEHIIQGIAS